MAKKHKTFAWRSRQIAFFDKYQKKCAVCPGFSKSKITLHHLSNEYEIGQEPDEALVPLCNDHHMEVHIYATEVYDFYTLEEATAIFLRLYNDNKDPLRRPRKRSQNKSKHQRKGRAKQRRLGGGKSKYYVNAPSRAK